MVSGTDGALLLVNLKRMEHGQCGQGTDSNVDVACVTHPLPVTGSLSVDGFLSVCPFTTGWGLSGMQTCRASCQRSCPHNCLLWTPQRCLPETGSHAWARLPLLPTLCEWMRYALRQGCGCCICQVVCRGLQSRLGCSGIRFGALCPVTVTLRPCQLHQDCSSSEDLDSVAEFLQHFLPPTNCGSVACVSHHIC